MTYPPHGTYGRDARYGDARPAGAYATLRSSDGSARAHFPPGVLTNVSIEPEESAFWDCELTAAPVLAPSRFAGGEFDLHRADGTTAFRAAIEHTDTAEDGTVSVSGRGRVGLALTDREIDVSYQDTLATDAIRDVWDRAGFSATVHDPPPQPITGETVRQAQPPADFRDLYEFYNRDERGRFDTQTANTDKGAGGLSAPSNLPDDEQVTTALGPSSPFELTPNGLESLQVNHFLEGEDYASKIGGASVIDVTESAGYQASRASGGQALRFDGTGMWASWDFTLDYRVPKDCLTVAVRYRGRGDQDTGQATAIISQNGTGISEIGGAPDSHTTQTPLRFTESFQFGWSHFPSLSPAFEAGEYSVSLVQFPDIDNDFDIDAVAVYDSRFASQEPVYAPGVIPLILFPNQPDDQNRLPGPGLFPPAFWFRSETATTGLQVESVTLDVEFAKATGYQLELRIPSTGQSKQVDGFPSGTTGSLTLAVDPGTTTPRIQTGIRLQTGDGGAGPPKFNNEANAIESMSLSVDGEAIAVLEDFQQSDTPMAIQQKLHERAGYLFSLTHGRPDEALIAESFRRGDPDLRRDLPGGLVVLNQHPQTDEADYANRVTVRGGERQFRAGRYEATVEDPDEIAARGLEAVEIERPGLNTHNDVLNRARIEKQDRLDADEAGVSLTTAPALAEPGYPYDLATAAGADLSGTRTLTDTGFATGDTTTLDFIREGGLAGRDDALVLALLGVGER